MNHRLATLAKQVRGPIVVDVGTDHGKLPFLLLENSGIRRIIATDISAPSLQKCIDRLADHPREQDAEFRVADGLQGMDTSSVNSIVIAGMGGHRIIGILQRALDEGKTLRRLILSPQKGEEEVRRFLHGAGYSIEEDRLLEEDEKFYTLLVAEPGQEAYEHPWQYRYGKLPLQQKSPILRKWLQQELLLQEAVLTRKLSVKSRQAVLQKVSHLKEVLHVLQDT